MGGQNMARDCHNKQQRGHLFQLQVASLLLLIETNGRNIKLIEPSPGEPPGGWWESPSGSQEMSGANKMRWNRVGGDLES